MMPVLAAQAPPSLGVAVRLTVGRGLLPSRQRQHLWRRFCDERVLREAVVDGTCAAFGHAKEVEGGHTVDFLQRCGRCALRAERTGRCCTSPFFSSTTLPDTARPQGTHGN